MNTVDIDGITSTASIITAPNSQVIAKQRLALNPNSTQSKSNSICLNTTPISFQTSKAGM